jgi:hypothetical protein
MNKMVVTAWIIAVASVIAAVVAAIVRPLHWERTVAAAVVIGVLAAAIAVVRSRRAAHS